MLENLKSAASNNTIEQYKAYFKNLNIEQYGASVLMNALNENQATEDYFQGSESGTTEEDPLGLSGAMVNIDSETVRKKILEDLEKEIRYFEANHPDIKGRYVVAVNLDSQDASGLPKIQIADKEDVLSLVNEADRQKSSDLIDAHPIQVFASSTLDVRILPAASVRGLDEVVAEFFGKYKGVFSYLASAAASAGSGAGASALDLLS